MWLVVVWRVGERSFCSQCVKRSPIEKPENKGFYCSFFSRGTPKNPYFPVLCYNMGTGEENGNANRTGTGRREKFNRLWSGVIIRVSQKTEPTDTSRFFNPFESRAIIRVSTGQVLERMPLLPIDKMLERVSFYLCSLTTEWARGRKTPHTGQRHANICTHRHKSAHMGNVLYIVKRVHTRILSASGYRTTYPTLKTIPPVLGFSAIVPLNSGFAPWNVQGSPGKTTM